MIHDVVDAPRSHAPLIDWARTARRLRAILSVIGAIVVAVWIGIGLFGGGFSARTLAELVGLGLLTSFAVEVVVVGGLTLRAMFAAGERGDRLAGNDVHILPPQLLRRHPTAGVEGATSADARSDDARIDPR